MVSKGIDFYEKNNIPLNFREENNSRISLLCSAAVLIVLVFPDASAGLRPDHQAWRKSCPGSTKEGRRGKLRKPRVTTASVIAVGDNLYHSKLARIRWIMIPATGIMTIFMPMFWMRSGLQIQPWSDQRPSLPRTWFRQHLPSLCNSQEVRRCHHQGGLRCSGNLPPIF